VDLAEEKFAMRPSARIVSFWASFRASPRASYWASLWATVLALILFAVAPSPAMAEDLPANAPTVTNVRLGAQPGATIRLVLDLDRAVEPAVSLLANPYRVVLDLPAANWRFGSGEGEGRGFVAKYRYGLFSPTQSRLVLDLSEPAIAVRAFLLEPAGNLGYRFVIDLAPTDHKSFMKAVRARRPVENLTPAPPAAQPSQHAAADYKPLIVIDPGHGGNDPGTSSAGKIREKNIALAAARELAGQLRATGRYRVELTRDRDIYIPLERRYGIARDLKADLFISVHADAIGNPNLRGGTIYTLSETASDKEAAALAAKENKADIIAGVDLNGETDEVSDIIIKLAQRESMNYSARFAQFLTAELGAARLIPKRPHRFAGFVVLKAPDVPSVLIEMGYLSNAADAKRLASRQGRRDIAAAVVRATNRYFDARLAQRF